MGEEIVNNFESEYLINEMKKVLTVEAELTPNGMKSDLKTLGYIPPNDTKEMLSVKVLKQFSLCREWLSKVDRIKTFNTQQGSYSYKHMVENSFRCYISNGAFIAAAISLDIPIKRCHSTSPNIYLPISQKSVKEMMKYTKPIEDVIE